MTHPHAPEIAAVYAATRASVRAYMAEQHPSRETCGEHRGYNTHLRRGEVTCIPCREAENAYRRARYAARKDAS